MEPFDELLIECARANELSNLVDCSRRWPSSDHLHLVGVHVHSIRVDDVPAKRNPLLKERRLVDAGIELMFFEEVVHNVQVSLMLFLVFGKIRMSSMYTQTKVV